MVFIFGASSFFRRDPSEKKEELSVEICNHSTINFRKKGTRNVDVDVDWRNRKVYEGVDEGKIHEERKMNLVDKNHERKKF